MHLLISRSQRALPALVLSAGLALGLTACSGSSGGSSDSAPIGSSAQEPAMRDAAGSAASAPDAVKEGAGTVVGSEQKIIRRADTSLLVKDVNRAADQVRAIASTAGGSVTHESLSTSRGESSDLSGSITISVPSDKLDDTMKRLAELGEVVSRTTSSDDVTAQYVDTESRLATMRASVDRVRALMAQATKIEDIVALESELSRRQADLESLEAQLRALKDQVAQSPISVQLSADRSDLADSGGGFLAGLKSGWKAFTSSVVLLLTALGALLPFLATLALFALPLVWFVRRRTRGRRQRTYAASRPSRPATPTAPPAASPATSQQPQPAPSQAPTPDQHTGPDAESTQP
jgi:hypothetical protein